MYAVQFKEGRHPPAIVVCFAVEKNPEGIQSATLLTSRVGHPDPKLVNFRDDEKFLQVNTSDEYQGWHGPRFYLNWQKYRPDNQEQK